MSGNLTIVVVKSLQGVFYMTWRSKNKCSGLQMVRTISARVAAASVYPLLAVGAGVPRRAAAAVPTGDILDASSTIKAWPICTGHSTDLAVLSIEALRACTRIIVHQILKERQERKQGEERRK